MPKNNKAPRRSETEYAGFFAPKVGKDLSSNAQRQAIGWLGLALPWTLLLSNGWRPYPNINGIWSSISLYYYSAGNAFFCGILFALTVFLFTYQGYENSAKKWDLRVGKLAGITAFLVAYFPTGPKEGVQGVPWVAVTDTLTGKVHLISAVVLFACFIVFSLFLFPRNADTKTLFEPPKKPRDWIYVSCGILMFACVAWAIVNQLAGRPIFWQETLALEFFGISWLVKSRVEYTFGYGRQLLREAFFS